MYNHVQFNTLYLINLLVSPSHKTCVINQLQPNAATKAIHVPDAREWHLELKFVYSSDFKAGYWPNVEFADFTDQMMPVHYYRWAETQYTGLFFHAENHSCCYFFILELSFLRMLRVKYFNKCFYILSLYIGYPV